MLSISKNKTGTTDLNRLNERGMIGLVELAALVALSAIIGFTVYRVITINSQVDNTLANTAESSQSAQKQPITIAQAEEEPEEVTIPEEKVVKEEELVKTGETPAKPQPPEDNIKDISYIKFVKGGGDQQGDSVVVSGTLESTQSGTCHFKFRKDGQEKVYQTSTLTSAKTCFKTIPVSDFGASGSWQFHLWFTSQDNLVQAYQDAYTIDVTK